MDDGASFSWPRLFHRWFIEYNPLYLLSAALVLLGAHVIYRDLIEASYLLGQLGVPAIAEIYAWTLIGGAALLTRIELRRPAVLLALLAVLYQGDLTLLTETSIFLGAAGRLAVALWLGSFALKLGALAWALRLRLSRAAFLVPMIGALGMVVLPRLFDASTEETASSVLGAWSFLLFAAGAWTSLAIRSTVDLDEWGRTVLRRGLAATWVMWSLMFVGHLWFAASEHRVSMAVLGPVALLVTTRWLRREATTWAAVVAALAMAGVFTPHAMWLVSLLAAITLGLRAWRCPKSASRSPSPGAPEQGPYRQPEVEASPPTPPVVSFGPAAASARRRLNTGALAAIYLSLWTLGWSGGPLPAHLWMLDLAFTLTTLVALFRLRLREPLLPLAAVHLHHAVSLGLLQAPDTSLEWGLSSVAMGFLLLIGSLAVSYRLRPRAVSSADP